MTARRLQSPLDSLLRLTDSSGRVLDWNDDYEHKDGFLHRDMGLLTHHADSYLRTQLPANGVYYVQLTDVQNHGGEAYGYRLRIGPPRPDFALRLTPSSINMFAGASTPVCVHVLRRDGFDGEVELVLKDAPRGFRLSGARIPAGRDRVRMTLTAPPRPIDDPIILTLEGGARIDGRTVSRPVIPAEDMMQAFLYRHLTPSQELMAAVIGGRRFGRPVEVLSEIPVRIPAGGAVRVRIAIPDHPQMRDIQLQLNEPPEGIALENVTVVPDGLMFQLTTRGNTIDVGFADNLIVDAFMDVAVKNENGDATGQTRRVFLGVLPAIPFEVVQR